MSYVWEQEYFHPNTVPTVVLLEWHLREVYNKDPMAGMFAVPIMGTWRRTHAVVRRLSERKYSVQFQSIVLTDNDKTFRSLKAAKAYALAVVTLDQ